MRTVERNIKAGQRNFIGPEKDLAEHDQRGPTFGKMEIGREKEKVTCATEKWTKTRSGRRSPFKGKARGG